MRVLVFGDSIIQGFNDPEGGWVGRLWKEFSKKNYEPTVFNLGVSGDTAVNLLKRFRNETENRKYPGESFAFVFSGGVNDSVFRGEEFESTPEEFFDHVTELINQAKEYSDKILFLGPTPVVDEMCNPIPWSKSGKCCTTERIRLFDTAMEKACSGKAEYLKTVDIFAGHDLKAILEDGTHPNEKGHQVIFEKVKPMIEEFLK